jgi:hypothetical protein
MTRLGCAGFVSIRRHFTGSQSTRSVPETATVVRRTIHYRIIRRPITGSLDVALVGSPPLFHDSFPATGPFAGRRGLERAGLLAARSGCSSTGRLALKIHLKTFRESSG